MRSLKPVDEQEIIRAATRSRMLVTVEDHLQTGGLYSIVAEVLLKHGVTVRTLPVSFEERWFKPGLLTQVLETEGLTPEKIAEKIYSSSNLTYA